MATEITVDPPPSERDDRSIRLARAGVVAVGLMFAATQLALLGLSRPPGWDESVYLSQVSPHAEALFFMASRARGISLLVSPVTLLGGSISEVRFFLVCAFSLAMAAAFWTWTSVIGFAAPIGAAAFSLSWVSLIGGSAVMPNMAPALAGVAVTGCVAQALRSRRRGPLVAASVLTAIATLFRPTDVTVLLGAIGVFVLVFERRRWRVLVPLATGLLLGWLPWVIEMSLRFGGLRHALTQAGEQHFAHISFLGNVRYYVNASAEGPLTSAPLSAVAMMWWMALVVFAGFAVAPGWSRERRRAAGLLSLGALAAAAEYLLAVSALAPRFLLPAHALLSLAAAVGVTRLLVAGRAMRLVGIGITALLLPLAVWQGLLARDLTRHEAARSAPLRQMGLAIADATAGRPCLVVGRMPIAFASGCFGEVPSWIRLSEADLPGLSRPGLDVYLVRHSPLSPELAAAIGSPVPIEIPDPGGFVWYAYPIPRFDP